MILALHANKLALEIPSWDVWRVSPIKSTIPVICLAALMVCVNIFVFISGWFGIKTNVRKIGSLLFQSLFCSVVAIVVAKYIFRIDFGFIDIVKSLSGVDYWFLISYLVLMTFAPVLNSFVEHASQKQIIAFLALFFILSFLYGRHPLDFGHFASGYSGISLCGLYVLGRYVRLYPSRWTTRPPMVDILVYVACVGVNVLLVALQTRIGSSYLPSPLHYNSPFTLIGSLFLFLAATKVKFHSPVINYIAPSVFSIYLIQENHLIREKYRCFADSLYMSFYGWHYVGAIACYIICVGLVCIMIDQVRRAICLSYKKCNCLDRNA